MRYAGWYILFLFLAASCLDEPDCYSLNNDRIGISFKRMSTGGTDTVYWQSVTSTSEYIDTILTYVENRSVTGISQMLIDYFNNRTSISFQGIDHNADLILDYKTQSQFVSEDCGNRFIITELNATSSTFDSVRVVNNVPGRKVANGVNIEIYRCPNRSLLRVLFTAAVQVKNITINGSATNVPFSQAASTQFRIPLDVNNSQSVILFTFADDTTKELIVQYEREQQTLFSKCGEQTVLSGLSVVSPGFSSVNVLNTNFLDPPRTNLEITF